jgi:hypothetical protein
MFRRNKVNDHLSGSSVLIPSKAVETVSILDPGGVLQSVSPGGPIQVDRHQLDERGVRVP